MRHDETWGAESATVFTTISEEPKVNEVIDTAGAQIEGQIMSSVEEYHFGKESSKTSLVYTEL